MSTSKGSEKSWVLLPTEVFKILFDDEAIADRATQTQLVSPGRGSAAGSLVAYALGITQVDPIEYGLLFGHFLRADATDYPDIDYDVSEPDGYQGVACRGVGWRIRSCPSRTGIRYSYDLWLRIFLSSIIFPSPRSMRSRARCCLRQHRSPRRTRHHRRCVCSDLGRGHEVQQDSSIHSYPSTQMSRVTSSDWWGKFVLALVTQAGW